MLFIAILFLFCGHPWIALLLLCLSRDEDNRVK